MGVTTYRRETYHVGANNSDSFALTYSYLLIESIKHATSGATVEGVKATIDSGNITDLAAGIKIKFDTKQNNLILENTNAFEVAIEVGYGVGDVEDYRFFQNSNFGVSQSWGAAFTSVMQETDQSVSGGTQYAKETQLTPSGSTATDTIEAATGRRRLISAKLKETSGTPDAMVVITMDDTSTNGDDWVFVCYAGEVATLPYPILMNDSASAGELHVQWLNGATGHAWLSYENGTVSASGAI